MKRDKPGLLAIIPNDYSIKEGLLHLKRLVFGISYYGKSTAPKPLPKHFDANKGFAKKTVLFTGDLMPTSGFDLSFAPSIKRFISDVDVVVINFEGVINNRKNGLQLLSHNKKIINDIKLLFENKAIIISCANNHANDFGHDIFLKSYNLLKESGFKVLGHKDEPSLVLGDLNFCSVSTLSNNSNPPIYYQKDLTSKDLDSSIKQDKFNILLPHWGIEFTRYPTQKQVVVSNGLLKKWDQIVGSHSHYPQILTSKTVNNTKKIIAYSLGNFCFRSFFPVHRYGALLKTEIGKLNGKPVLIKSEYIDTRCSFKKDRFHIQEFVLK